MKRALSYVLTLVMLLSLLTGCSTQGNLSGTMVDEPCELEEGTLNLHLANNLQGGFTFAQTEGGWTILDENSQYVAYDEKSAAVIRTDEAYDWVFSNGSFSTADGTVYLGDGLTVSAEAVPATFTKLVETDPEADSAENPKSDSAVDPKSESTQNSAPEGTTATLEINGETSYYKTFSEAWNAANQNTDKAVIVTLLTDVNGANGDSEGFDELQMETRSASLTLDLNDHTLDRGLTSSTDSGRVFNLQEKGTLIIKNGTITGGNNTDNGGGFYINKEGLDLTLKNLTITGNHTDTRGSGIYITNAKSKVTLDNVTITGNTADGSGALFWGTWSTNRSTLTFKNKVTITDNTGADSLNNFVYDGHGWCGWLNTDSMSTDSKIGVSYFDGGGGPLADTFGDRVNELKGCFFPDQDDHEIITYKDSLVVKAKTDVVVVYVYGEWYMYDSFDLAWDKANQKTSHEVEVTLYGDVKPSEESMLSARSASLVIDLNGYTIDRGLTTPTDSGRVFNLQKWGTVTIKNGTVTGGNNTGNGGGFYVGGGIKLTLENLTITGNHATESGSGIYMAGYNDTPEGNRKVTLDNVTITGNSAEQYGAMFWGLYRTQRMSLVFKNKVEISGNTGAFNFNNLVYDGYGWCGWLDTDSMSTDSKIGVCYFDGDGGPLADSFGSRLEELRGCFFADQTDHEITSGDGTLIVKYKTDVAAVIYNGEWSMYDNFVQAWGNANDKSKCSATMLFFTDWVAENGSFGGAYFFEYGALCPRERDDDDTWLNVDLNGHKIDRGLYNSSSGYSKRDNGCVFYIRDGSDDVNICIKNGTITGGANTGNGGGITISNSPDNLILRNIIIKNNYSGGNGGGVYISTGSSVSVKMENCTVIHNSAGTHGDGVYTETRNLILIGKIYIYYNDKDDLYCRCDGWEKTKGFDARKLTIQGSKIGVRCNTYLDSKICQVPKDEAVLDVFHLYENNYYLKLWDGEYWQLYGKSK